MSAITLETADVVFLDEHFFGGWNLNSNARTPKDGMILQEILEAIISDIDAMNDRATTPFEETLLSAHQLIDGAAGGIAPAMILSITGQPTATDTITIDDGATPETYTAVAGAPGAFEFQIGGSVAITMANFVASVMANSLLWNAYVTTTLNRFFVSTPANQVLLVRKLATATAVDRVYATLTGLGTIQIVDFTTAGFDNYDLNSGTESAIATTDPGSGQFGFGRVFASLVPGEVHVILDDILVLGHYWDESSQAWIRFARNRFPSQAGSPNAGTGTPGEIADIDVDTTNDVLYFNPDGGATTWRATVDEDLGGIAVLDITQAGQPLITETLTIGADVYEADGVGANINFVIAGTAEGTMDNLIAAINNQGTENVAAVKLSATNFLVLSADAPGGNAIAGDPNIATASTPLTNYTFSIAMPGNFNTEAGRAAGLAKTAVGQLTINAAHIAYGSARLRFPFTVARFSVLVLTATGVIRLTQNDTFAIDNGDVLVTLNGGAAPDIQTTDVVTVQAWS